MGNGKATTWTAAAAKVSSTTESLICTMVKLKKEMFG
jgi:hypothetical protein